MFTNLFTGGLARGLRGRLIDELGPSAARRRPIRWRASRSRRSAPQPSGKATMGLARCGPARPPRSARRCRQRSSRGSWPPMRWRSCKRGRRGAAMEIVAVPAFNDNYLWLVHDAGERRDGSGRSGRCRAGARRSRAARLDHHADLEHPLAPRSHRRERRDQGRRPARASPVPASENIPGRDVALKEGDEVRLGNHVGRVIEVPGHTLGHIALIFDDEASPSSATPCSRWAAGGCSKARPQQMYRSLQRLTGLPTETRSTARTNIPFRTPGSPRMPSREIRRSPSAWPRSRQLRERGEITVPTTVAQERETNPFVRATDEHEFARLRKDKDSFRS